VTALYDDDYGVAVRVLAYSLQKVKTQARLVCLYIPGQVSSEVLSSVGKAGWELIEVERIVPPHPPSDQYRDQFTKLRIWDLTQFEAVFYMDGDTLVLRNFDELWGTPSEFGAVRHGKI
jgi:inositol phosphorylceramide glucuronosyltransferase 1